jgi:hypothetical protein
MQIVENFRPEYILLILFALIVGWFLLRFLLKFTARLFTCGCLVLAILGAGWILFTILN